MIDKLLMSAIDNKKHYYLTLIALCLPIVCMTLLQTLTLAYIIDAVFLKGKSLIQVAWPLIGLLLIFILRPLLQALFEWHNRTVTSKAKQTLRRRLSESISQNYQTLENENTTGYFATIACDGIESTDAYFSEFVPQLFIMSVNTLALLMVAFYFDWISALIMMITAPLIPVFMILIGKTAEGVNQKQWQSLKWMNGHLLDLLRGMTTLHYFGKHHQQSDAVARTSQSFKQKTMSVLKLTFLSALALELTATLSTAVIAVSLGVRLLYAQIPFIAALSILLMTPEYYLPLRQLGLKYHAAMNAKAVSAQLKPIFASETPTNLDINLGLGLGLTTDAMTKPDSFSANAITLHQINFAYENANPIFKQFSLEIPFGSSLAITGPSGVGKTTLLKLLLGELTPQSGNGRLLGEDYLSMSKEMRHKKIAFVPQQPKVFEGTLLENLRFGRPEASLDDVKAFCDLSAFSLIIDRLPEGLDTLMGEGQQALSGGETQLLAITRACIRKTPILILDEPTSALDPISEALITEALSRIAKDKTLIIAAHRKASVALCQHQLHLGGAHNE
jgi:ATP-binding cassette subfamily C protein CydD